MTETQPSTTRTTAVQNAAAVLSSLCGRDPSSEQLRTCPHDHTADAEALVRSVEQYAFPELLRELKHDADFNPDMSLDEVVTDKIVELEARALTVPPR